VSGERQLFTVDDARALMPDVLKHASSVVQVRADLAELAASLNAGDPSVLGGVPEAKGLEAQLHELLGWFTSAGLELKGWAPLLVDFPSVLDGHDVLLCWLEGEPDLEWYHRTEFGFAGRRRLS
jgi:hypothetical protein